MSEFFHHKKLLLAQRDALLEALGLESFGSGDLPKEFRELPQEFRNMDVLLQQLRDRQRQLKEDHDLIHLDYLEYMAQIQRIENEYGQRIQPLRRELNEVQLNIQYVQDQLKNNLRKYKDSQELDRYRFRAAELQKQITQLEKSRNAEVATVHVKLDPIGARLQVFDNAIRKVREESEHLSSARARRMRDLGYQRFSSGIEDETHDPRFDEVQRLIDELATNRKEVYEEEEDLPKRNQSKSTFGFFFAIGLAFMLVVVFRTQYRFDDVSFSGIVMNFLHDGSDSRLFLDLDLPQSEDWLREIPEFNQLPGGEVLAAYEKSDLRHYVGSVTKLGTGDPRFYGLRFRKSMQGVVKQLSKLGWRHCPTKGNWEAMTDDTWVWLLFDAQTFFILRNQDMEAFEKGNWTQASDLRLHIERWVAPFSSDQPLLYDLKLMSLSCSDSLFRLELAPDGDLEDGEERKRRLEQIQSVVKEGPISWLQIQGQRLIIEFPPNYFSPNQFLDPKLQPTLIGFISGFFEEYQRGLAKRYEASVATAETPPSTLEASQKAKAAGARPGPSLLVMRALGDRLDILTSLKLSGPAAALAYRKSDGSLLVSSRTSSEMVRFQLKDGFLLPVQKLEFGQKSVRFNGLGDFQPGPIVFDSREQVAVVLERRRENRPGRLLLLRGLDLEPVTVNSLPADIEQALAAVWDSDASQLFVSVAARESGGDSARAVLIYRREGDRLFLSQFVNAAASSGGTLRIPGIAQPADNQLLLYQLPQHRLCRYQLEDSTYLPVAQLELKPLKEGIHALPTRQSAPLELGRTRGNAILLDQPDGNADLGAKAVFFIDFQGQNPVIVNKLELVEAPFACQRIPLHDSFWISVPKAQLLVRVNIENKRLRLQSTQFVEGFAPEHLMLDEWGDHLFISGER